jgi:hypothetical protein
VRKALPILIFVLIGLFATRFLFGGGDTWICEKGEWIKHGNPSAPKPEERCGVKVKIVEDSKEKLEDISKCVSSGGFEMNYSDARKIAKENCVQGSLKDEHFCNDSTGTWWIDFAPNEPKEGCNPACVVNIETETAEINWRCTGLIQEN